MDSLKFNDILFEWDMVPTRDPPAYHWPDSEVPRTAERLRDLTAVAIAASTYAVEGAMTGRMTRARFVAGIARSDN